VVVRRLLPVLFTGYLMSVVGPFAAVLNFVMQRDRIARELCVQRAVPDAQRTCHGQCHLRKQLQEAGAPASDKAPAPPTFRYEEQVAGSDALRLERLLPLPTASTVFREPSCTLLPGHVIPLEGVPRA